MATVGLRYAVFAPITKETRSQELVYGTGVVVGRAIRADISWERNDNPLNADDMEIANDNSLVGGTINFNLDAVREEARKVMFGDYQDGETGEWEDNTEAAPYGGFGTLSVVMGEGNKYSYEAMWLHKCQFGQNSETLQTKGRTIEYQTPTINGRILGVYNNTESKPRVRRRKTFETAGAAIEWLNRLAQVAANDNAAAAAEA